MMINEIGGILNKNFSAGNIQGNSNAGNKIGLVSTGKINGQPRNDIYVQNIKLKEACTQFEQIFIKYMVDKMWSGTDITGGKKSIEKSVWQDYFNNEISKVIAESSMTGISETLFDQLGAALTPVNGTDKEAPPDAEIEEGLSVEIINNI
jgi:Rod binding domain-containing protein